MLETAEASMVRAARGSVMVLILLAAPTPLLGARAMAATLDGSTYNMHLTLSGPIADGSLIQDLVPLPVDVSLTGQYPGNELKDLEVLVDNQVVQHVDFLDQSTYQGDVGPLDATPAGGLAPGQHDFELFARSDNFEASIVTTFTIQPNSAPVLQEDPDVFAAAKEFYMQKYSVSADEATRRLTFQGAVSKVAADVEAALGSADAGLWFDNADGSRLKVGVKSATSPPSGPQVDDARSVLEDSGLLAQSDFMAEQFSEDDLDEARPSLDTALEDLLQTGKVSTGKSHRNNALTIKTANDLTVQELTRVNSVATQMSVRTLVAPTGLPSANLDETACTERSSSPFLWCDSPLRGGVFIEVIGTEDKCTAGFLTKSTIDGLPYLMTAGHCLRDAPTATWYSRDAQGNFAAVGTAHSFKAQRPGPQADDHDDAGLIRLPLTGPFSKYKAWVVVTKSGGDVDSPRNTAYEIRDVRPTPEELTVCTTAGILNRVGRFTQCGDVTDNDARQGSLSHLVEVGICQMVKGSSGGPVYREHIAYGILAASAKVGCLTYYQSALKAAEALHVRILRTG
jgi:hypothetical protein